MTLKRHLLNKRALRAALPLAGLGIAAAAFTGCGGASTTNNPTVPTPNSGPVVYGLNDLGAASGLQDGETSGITFTPTGGSPEGALVGAVTYHTVSGAGPLQSYQLDFPNLGTTSSPGVALGFGTSGTYFNSAASAAVAAIPTNYTGTLVFGAYASAGVLNSNPDDINPTSIVLTSSEAPTFSQPLSFDGTDIGTGVLSQVEYRTQPFMLPAFMQTTGLHNLHTTISTVSGQSSTTDFDVLCLAPTDSAVLTPVTASVPTGQPTGTEPSINSYTATITSPIAGVATYTTVDTTNNTILFAAPGSQTITVTANVTLFHTDGTTQTVTQTGTETDLLVAGQLFLGAGVTVAGSTPATASARPHAPRLLKHH